MTIVYALAILWLALTGSFEGWSHPLLLAINGLLAVAALGWWAWLLWRGRGINPLSAPLLALWLAYVLASIANGASQSLFRLYYFLALIAVYHLPVNLPSLRRGAWWAGWAFFPLAILFRWENGVSASMNIWAIYFLAMDRGRGRAGIAFSALAGGALLATRAESGLLAALAGAIVWFLHLRQHRPERALGPLFSLPALFGLLAVSWLAILTGKAGHYGSLGVRWDLYKFAASRLTWPGRGPDTFSFTSPVNGWSTWDQHNLLLTVAWDGGLPALAALGWLVYRITRLGIPPWAGAWLAAFISHALVDSPLTGNFFTAAGLMIILGGLRYAAKRPADGVRLHRWRQVC